jgi:hypothetical protein
MSKVAVPAAAIVKSPATPPFVILADAATVEVYVDAARFLTVSDTQEPTFAFGMSARRSAAVGNVITLFAVGV